MMIIANESSVSIPVEGPLYLPFYNIWLQNVYTVSAPFELDPFQIRAQSTSGSPVILGKSAFVGFMNESGGRYVYDGAGRLDVLLEPGQELYVETGCDPWEAWSRYNAQLLGVGEAQPKPAFWSDLEYCTWVEQKKIGFSQGLGYTGALDHKFVEEYVRRIDRLGLPRGKFTIDDGWAIDVDSSGRKLFGDWEIDRAKFPKLEQTVRFLTEEGFTPGLWFAAGFITPNSQLAKQHPDWVGENFQGPSEIPKPSERYFLTPCKEVRQHYIGLFAPFVQMGVKKFKLDMYYENKQIMKELLQLSYEAIKQLDPEAEVEIHVPDIFVSRFGDTIRTNDVLIKPEFDWRGTTEEHYRVCRFSSPDKIINLDHIGSNNQDVPEELFMEHWSMQKEYEGYPVISLLPDHFSAAACSRFVEELKAKHAALRS
jgi:hypothetical protein